MVRGVPLRAALLGAGAALVLALGPANAQDMNAEVEALKKRVAELESGTSVTVSGFVKADFYIDNRDDLGNTFTFSNPIRLDGDAGDDDEDGAIGMHAQQSRFALSTSTPTSFGALNTVAEIGFDPYADAPGSPKVRLAYGALGPVLAGRAWSIRGDNHTFADTVEFDGPVGVVADRFEQIRLTLPLGEGFTGQMAVEPGIGGNDEVPTFLAALRYSAGWGAVNLTGSVGQYDDGAGQSATTHTLHVGAHFKATSATKVLATLNMTRGDGQIYGSAGATGTDDSGDLKAYDSIGGMAGVSHGWSDSIRSGVFYGWVENDNPGMALDKTRQTVHANVIWSPVPQADIGFEVIYGSRETNAGATGEATRFQIGVKYGF